MVQSQSGQIIYDTQSQKEPITKKGLVEWLKKKAAESITNRLNFFFGGGGGTGV
jgi:hypothetical protein